MKIPKKLTPEQWQIEIAKLFVSMAYSDLTITELAIVSSLLDLKLLVIDKFGELRRP